MGFHKRWINKTNLLIRYKDGGIDSVKSYLNADALMISDDFSVKIVRLLTDDKDEEAIKLFNDATS